MTCLECEPYMVTYLDGELSIEIESEIQAHLEACQTCRDEAQSFRDASLLIRSEPLPEPSETWDMALEQKLTAQKLMETSDELQQMKAVTDALSARLREIEGMRKTLLTDDPLMTVDELALYLRVTAETVFEVMEALPRIELGYDVRFRKSSIDAWLKLRETQPQETPQVWNEWIFGGSSHLSS